VRTTDALNDDDDDMIKRDARHKPSLPGELFGDFEAASVTAAFVFVPLVAVVVDDVLAFAAELNFLGFGAGAGGRVFMAVGETANHSQSVSLYIASHYHTVPLMRSVHRVLLKQMRLKRPKLAMLRSGSRRSLLSALNQSVSK